MSKDKTYDGWSSYETWSVNSWMDNDEGSQDLFSMMATTTQGGKDDNVILSSKLTGNSSALARRRLRKDRPDIHNRTESR